MIGGDEMPDRDEAQSSKRIEELLGGPGGRDEAGARSLAGGVPEPDELFGRDHLIRFVWEQLAGNNVFLIAPRRFGKTGVMNHLLRRPRPEFAPVYLEVEDVHDPVGFAGALVTALLERDAYRAVLSKARGLPAAVMDLIGRRVEEIKTEVFGIKLREALGGRWEDTAKALVLEMEKAQETLLVIIDEFPQFIDNVAKRHGDDAARDLLLWFRSLRLKQRDRLRRFRFVIAGSTSIDMILRRLEAPDKLNDFFRVPVEALAPEAARELLRVQAGKYGLRFGSEAEAAVFECISPPVPYFIHLLLAQIRMQETLAGRELTAADIREVYATRLLGPTCRAYFDYYRQRLKRYGKHRETAAISVLQALSASDAGRVSDSVLYDVYRKARRKGATSFEFDEIMADLESDWYVLLDTATNEYHFLLTTMRDWWRRFYRSRTRRTR